MPRGLGSFRRGFVRALRPTTLRHTGTRIEWDWRCYSTAPHHCISTFHLPTTHAHRPLLRHPRIQNTHRITATHHRRMRAPVVEAPLGACVSPPGLVKCLQLAGNASASLRPHTAAPKTRRMQMPMGRDEPERLRSAHAPRATTASRHHRPSMPRPGAPRAGRSRQNPPRQN